MFIKRRQMGLTLIELIIFIVIVSVGLAGVLTVLNVTTKASADPMIRKNMLAMAESLLEEVQLQSFTWCDPDDVNAATAMAYVECTPTMVQNTAAGKTGESRGSNTTPLDNVLDYNALLLPSPMTSLTGAVPAPAGYSASIGVAAAALNEIPAASDAALLITVVVCHANACSQNPAGDFITLQGYRTRFAPNSMP